MKLKIAQVIGLNTDQKAAQVASAVREDNAFLAVLILSCDDAFTKGRQILSELEDFYFEFEGSLSEKLNAAFTEADSKFSKEEDRSLCLAAVVGKVLYIIGQGQVEVYLKRVDKVLPLLSVGAPSQLISGFIRPGDRLLFSTHSLVTFLDADLEKSLNLPIDAFEEEVGSKIGVAVSENEGLAALLIETVEEEISLSSTPIPPASPALPEQDLIKKPAVSFSAILGKAMTLIGKLWACFPKRNKTRLILGILLIVIIVLGIGYKYKTNRDRQTQTQFNQMLQQARDDLNAAKGLSSLNPAEAKTKLDLAKEKVNKALALKPKDSNARDLKKQIDSDASAILQQSAIADFPLFLDMDLVKKNFRATRLSLSTGKLLLLDPGMKTLAVVDLAKKSNQILAGPAALGDAVFASLNGAIAFIYSKDKGILKIDINNQKLTAVSKKDKNQGDIKDIYGFAGNVYLLDAGGQIWKYLPVRQAGLPTTDGYSDGREYLSLNTKADLSSAFRMQIESSIYVLKTGGEILRFTKGDKDNFALSGLDKGVKDPKSFFVSSDTDNLYVLDSGNARLLILTKTGGFKGQISGSKFGTVTDLAVDEIGKKVYLLEGSKIFQADLK